VLKAYGAWGLKKMYGKEYEGVIRSTFIIDPEGNIAATWYKVRVKGHVEAVKEKLKELKASKLLLSPFLVKSLSLWETSHVSILDRLQGIFHKILS